MSSADEGQGRVSAGVFEYHVGSTGMTFQEIRAIVHEISNHDPTTVDRIVPRNFVQIDRPPRRLDQIPFVIHRFLAIQHSPIRFLRRRLLQLEKAFLLGLRLQIHASGCDFPISERK